jgi:hypothetical protein
MRLTKNRPAIGALDMPDIRSRHVCFRPFLPQPLSVKSLVLVQCTKSNKRTLCRVLMDRLKLTQACRQSKTNKACYVLFRLPCYHTLPIWLRTRRSILFCCWIGLKLKGRTRTLKSPLRQTTEPRGGRHSTSLKRDSIKDTNKIRSKF